MIYFTSDLHFSHKNVIQFCSRPWLDVDSMNLGLIKNWNDTVLDQEDEVYILGDLFFCGTIKAKEILSQLRGKKYLIQGNHDWGKIKKHRAEEFGFGFIVDQFCMRIGNQDVKLSHFPYKGGGDHTEGEERYNEYRCVDDGGWLLHGHVHRHWVVKNKQINVGVDVWGYKPVPIAMIEHLLVSESSTDPLPKRME